LPDFIRSCFTDGKKEKIKTGLKKKRWPVIAAGRVYGGNAGLAFAMCEALQKRKNRQGGWKHRYDLIFWFFCIKTKEQ
jgi:hypothetical protein